MEFAQLSDRADTPVESLSGGMKRRLTIARSLVNDPELLLLDEPTTGLDPQARHLLWDRLYRLKREGVTQIVTTHYMDEAEQLCDRLVVMDGGRDRRGGLARGADRAVLHPRGAGAAVRGRRPGAGRGGRAAGGAGRGAAGPAAALHRGRRAPAGRAGPQRACGRCRRWCGARRWRTCSSGSPAGRWWTDDGRPRPAPPATGAAPRPAGRGAAGRRAPLDVVPAQLAGHGRLLDPAAAAVPARLRRRVRRPDRRHGRAAQATGGVDYLVWLAPALLCVSAVQTARVRLDLPGAVGLQVAAVLPGDDGHADRPGPGRGRAPRLAGGQDRRLAGAVYVAVIAAFGGVRSAGASWRC